MDTLVLIMLGVLSRLMPHPANFTAVGGIALFSGARLSLGKAAVIVVSTMVISDLFLGFHSVMWATYGSMLLAVGIGRILTTRRSIAWVGSMTCVSSLVFFLVTNFAVWAVPGSMYPKTLEGLWQSYIMALPFFRNSLLGDVFYTSVFFGGYELVEHVRYRVSKEYQI